MSGLSLPNPPAPFPHREGGARAITNKQIQDYQSEGLDWRQIARERIFPFLAERQTGMQAAHINLLKSCEPIYRAAQKKFGYAAPLMAVIYVGIGSGQVGQPHTRILLRFFLG